MNSRRNFIKKSMVASAGLAITPSIAIGNSRNPFSDKLKLAFIGVGGRGMSHMNNALKRDDIEITAVCDIDPKAVENALHKIKKAGFNKPKTFGKSDYDYRNLLDDSNVDAVVISTPWLWHTRMTKDAMLANVYAGVEVSAANTMEECWDLVNTHEKTGTHMMILENVNYRRDVLAVLNMVKQNVFGELVHFRCGYQHDLRDIKFTDGTEFGKDAKGEARWRTQHSLLRNGDVYPTHGVGPIAAMCDINRGNRFESLVSSASKPIGLHNYIVKNGGEDHPNAKLKWKLGDVITTTIETSNGETILITHDTNLPRPYSLGFRVQGANGLWEVDGNRIYIEGKSKPHAWDAADKWLKKYDHPLWKKYGEYASGSGHGGMDFFVMNAFVESAKQNIAPPMDAYDAAAWSAITPLSEQSIANNGEPQDFPDFTRGNWINRKPYNWMKDSY